MRRRGENISSFEVERSVNAHPGVLETAAYPVPSELGEDEVMVAVVPRDGRLSAPFRSSCSASARTRCRASPFRATFASWAELPKTPTARVQKHVLRAEGITADSVDREAAGIVVARSSAPPV